MLNPSEIANKRFDKSMGRYKAEDVERYLAQLADEVGELMEDKHELEQKIMVLADKLEEYKNDEESLRAALLGAQKLGDSVVRDSKAKAGMIMEEAGNKADSLMNDARRAIEREKASFVRMQREVATFKSKLQLLYKQHLELISSIPVDETIIKAASKPVPQEEPAEIPPAPFEMPEEETLPADEAYTADMQPEDALEYTEQPLEYSADDVYTAEQEQSSKRESRFGPLKFGREFDIKRDDEKRKK